ncbi:MAG: hypothetical protein AB1896_05920 [Thermodesulfobacteriota bacterium]
MSELGVQRVKPAGIFFLGRRVGRAFPAAAARAALGLLLLTALVLGGGCGLPETRVKARPFPGRPEETVGLALAERVFLDLGDRGRLELTLLEGAAAEYQALLSPGDLATAFRRADAGNLYLAYVPVKSLPRSAGELTVVLTGHEVRGRGLPRRTTWPRDQAPVLTAALVPGRITYLGVIERIIESASGGAPVTRLSLKPDPEGLELWGPCLDNPWLRERLLGPPPGF